MKPSQPVPGNQPVAVPTAPAASATPAVPPVPGQAVARPPAPTVPGQQPPPIAGQAPRPAVPGQQPAVPAVPGRPATSAAPAAPGQRSGVLNPAARPAGSGPGTGVPNPNYQYSTKPPLLGTGLQRDILSLLIKVAVIVGIAVGLFTFVFGLFQYDSPSMNPAVHSGDLIMFSRFDRTYFAQDLIVVSYQGEMQVRRVVATVGDVVDFYDGRFLIDGVPQQEDHIYTETFRYVSEIDFPLTVPEGYVFVLADHREYSTDSRTYGAVRISDTQGKVTNILRSRLF